MQARIAVVTLRQCGVGGNDSRRFTAEAFGGIMRSMSDQLDLFSATNRSIAEAAGPAERPAVDLASLDDPTLIEILHDAGSRVGVRVAHELGRRGLAAAVPALEHYCRLYAAFGVGGISREQDAALDALTAIGGHEAVRAAVRLIERGDVQGTTLNRAVNLVADHGPTLPITLIEAFVRADDPALRRDGCRLARRWPSLVPTLIGLLDDTSAEVKISAACVLGQMGCLEAKPLLLVLLRGAPSSEVIDATAGVADEECIVQLGRLARSGSALAAAAIDALHSIDHPLAEKLVMRLNGKLAFD